jgi:hypothetical protein
VAQAIFSRFETSAMAQLGVDPAPEWRAAIAAACRDVPGISVLDIQVRKDRLTGEGVVVSVPAVGDRPGIRRAFFGRQARPIAAALRHYLKSARTQLP